MTVREIFEPQTLTENKSRSVTRSVESPRHRRARMRRIRNISRLLLKGARRIVNDDFTTVRRDSVPERGPLHARTV
jgi:hypothetical protein